MIRQYLLILFLLSLFLLGCSTQSRKKIVEAPPPPLIHIKHNPQIMEVISRLVYMKSDPNVFKYKEPSLDKKFGISKYK